MCLYLAVQHTYFCCFLVDVVFLFFISDTSSCLADQLDLRAMRFYIALLLFIVYIMVVHKYVIWISNVFSYTVRKIKFDLMHFSLLFFLFFYAWSKMKACAEYKLFSFTLQRKCKRFLKLLTQIKTLT